MEQYKNLNSWKTLKTLLILLFIFVVISAMNNAKAQQNVRDHFFVDKIYDYHDNLLLEYIYDDNNRVMKTIYTNVSVHPTRTDVTRSEGTFEYMDGRVSTITDTTTIHTDYHGFETHDDYYSKTSFEYDSQGKLIKKNGQDLNFHYENGRVVSIGANVEPYIVNP